MGAKINCSICGKSADVDMENCPHCGSPMKVGRPVAPVTPALPVASSGEACPSCGAPVQDGDIVCVRCGVNLLTGHTVVRKQSQAASAGDSAGKPPYALIGLLAAAVLVVVAGVAAFLLLRDPVSQARQEARAGNLLPAVEILQKHTESHAEDVEAFALLGRLYMQTQQFPNASSALDTAARLDPADEELAFMAVLAAGKIPGDAGLQRQIDALERMVEHHPDNTRALRMLALAQGAAGKAGASAATVDKLAQSGAPASEVDKLKGIVAALDGKLEAARAALDAAGPGDPDVQLAEGYVASLSGDRMAAADALNSVVSRDSGADGEARTRLGLLNMAQGDFDAALPLLRPTDAGRPSESARFFYALCLQTAGLEDDALLDYDKLVSSEGPFAENAAIQMAMIYLARGNVDRASELTRKARKFGNSARLHTVEGQIKMLQDDVAGAQESFRQAIGADDTYPAAHLEQGLAYVRRGVLTEGVRELKRYLALVEGGVPGGRVNEVDLLVTQLEQAAGRDGASS